MGRAVDGKELQMISETGSTAQQFQSCEASLQIFASRDFRHWRGLPPTCSLEEVTRAFPLLNDGIGLARLGKIKRQFRMLAVEGYDHPVQIWLDGSRVLLLDAQYPQISPMLPDLLRELGEPAAKLTLEWNTLRLDDGEWVYPERGLALFINPSNNVLLHLAVFSPTTLDVYLQELRLRLAKKPLR